MCYQDRVHKVTTAARPWQLKHWIDRGRQLGKVPVELGDLDGYGEAMRDWYTNIMPLWRRSGGLNWPLFRAKGPEDTWLQIMHGGRNGLQIVVIAVYWWLQMAGTNQSARAQAESVCEDLVFALSAMHSNDWYVSKVLCNTFSC